MVATTSYVWNNPEDAREFPDTPHPLLEGHMPLDVGLTELGNGRYTKPAIIVMQPRKFKSESPRS